MPLYIVATPIGHLADLSYRAVEVLKSVDFILCEDTRQTSILLKQYGIQKSLESYHHYSEAKKVDRIVSQLQDGLNIALVSDAGTPLISDPGFSLVRALQEAHMRVIPIPGPCAAIAALSVSGLSTHDFYFAGFLSAKSGERRAQLVQLKERTETLVFYEAPHRILETLVDMEEIIEDRHCVLAKELTKQFEHIEVGTAAQILSWLQEDSLRQKGEFVVLVQGKSSVKKQADLPETIIVNTETLLSTLAGLCSTKDAAQAAALLTGLSKNQLYQYLVEHPKYIHGL